MNGELQTIGRPGILRYYPSIFLEGLRKTTNNQIVIAGFWAKNLIRDRQNTME
jgi:hypothetical protein